MVPEKETYESHYCSTKPQPANIGTSTTENSEGPQVYSLTQIFNQFKIETQNCGDKKFGTF